MKRRQEKKGKKREIHELPYVEMVKSGTIGLASAIEGTIEQKTTLTSALKKEPSAWVTKD